MSSRGRGRVGVGVGVSRLKLRTVAATTDAPRRTSLLELTRATSPKKQPVPRPPMKYSRGPPYPLITRTRPLRMKYIELPTQPSLMTTSSGRIIRDWSCWASEEMTSTFNPLKRGT